MPRRAGKRHFPDGLGGSCQTEPRFWGPGQLKPWGAPETSEHGIHFLGGLPIWSLPGLFSSSASPGRGCGWGG